MSSADEDEGGRPIESKKKRKLQRACDVCKRKKIGCDGARMPGKRCSNCTAGSFDCTYVAASKKRAPSRTYVEGLENRLEKMEELLQRFVSDADLAHEVENDAAPLINSRPPPGGSFMSPPSGPIGKTGFTSHTRAEDDLDDIAENFERLDIDIGDGKKRFFGASSSFTFLQTALELQDGYAGTQTAGLQGIASECHIWDVHPWERRAMEQPEFSYIFPEDDLRIALIDLYFEKYHPYMQLLHRPTFERSIEQGLHQSDRKFGATVLMVCAIASRFSNDPRIFLEGLEGREKLQSSGWKWFNQVHVVSRSLLDLPSLYELQFYCLAIPFLQGSSVPQACWPLVGVGLRMAQEVGAHRRNPHSSKPTIGSELWKRAFWLLICFDTSMCALLGRPCCMNDEDFNQDLPLLCDDEYWENPDPEQAFKQPPGKPSMVAYLRTCISLNVIFKDVLHTLYSVKKSTLLGQEQEIVAELDSALNQWMDSVPEHLRWDPNRENEIFFNQSAILYAVYYHVQILIHRPFISSPRKHSGLSFPSLAICTNAARSCCHVMDTQRRRGPLALPQVQVAVFTSGVVLLLHLWGGQRVGLASNKSKGMEDVNKCIQVLKDQEDRWHSGGRFCNILYGMASAGNVVFPDDPPPRNKRERDMDSATSTATSLSDHSFPCTPEGSRSLWGTLSNKASPPPNAAPTDVSQLGLSAFTLPINSDELGRLPAYSQFDFTNVLGPSSTNNNSWESGFFDIGHLPPFDPNLSGHIPPIIGNAQEDLPVELSVNDLFYDQMASVFSGWKGPVPELPRGPPSTARPYQYQGVPPINEGQDTMRLHTHASVRDLPAVWDGSHNWNSTYTSLQEGNSIPQGDSRF